MIRGSGPLATHVDDACKLNANIVFISQPLSKYELNELIKNAYCLIWPSKGIYENFGMIAAESLYLGTPVIASNSGVMKEMINSNSNGLLYQEDSLSSLIQAIQTVSYNPSLRDKLSKNAMSFAKEKFSSLSGADNLISLYDLVLSEHENRR